MYYSQLIGGKLVPLKDRLGTISAKAAGEACQRRTALNKT